MALHRHKLVVYSFRQSLWERSVEVDDPEQKDNGGSSLLVSVKSLSLLPLLLLFAGCYFGSRTMVLDTAYLIVTYLT